MQCDQVLLWTLIEQDVEPTEALDSMARHLETCPNCRRELTAIGGDASWWRDASEYLAKDEVCKIAAADKPNSRAQQQSGETPSFDSSREGADSDLTPLPSIDLSFLDPPSHPEMLGRIGRYDVEGLLGRGGMGVVMRGYDSDLHRSVAIKVLAPEWAASELARQRFAREAQAAASVAHQHVVPIYNVEADAQLPYLVMAYIPGMTLERWVRTHGVPDTATVLRVAGQLADGLGAAHRRGLVHRDVKPGNIMVGEHIARVWITDFGLARAADSVTLTRTGVIAGTPHYMSPEQARGEAIDHRSDLFSLGCVLYFLAAGVPPFDAENTLAVLHKIVSTRPESLATRRHDLPPSFVNLVDQLLERRIDRRPDDCEAVSRLLQTATDELEKGRVAPAPRKFSWRVAAMIAVPFALLTISSVLLMMSTRPPRTFVTSPGLGDTSQASADPWQHGGRDLPQTTPYVLGASAAIDSAMLTDMSGIRQRIETLQRRADDLATQSNLLVAPSISFGDQRWRQQVSEIVNRLKRMEALSEH